MSLFKYKNPKVFMESDVQVLLQALKDLTKDFELRSVGQDTDDTRYRKAKDVIAKFERVL